MTDPNWLTYLKEWPGLLIAGFALWIMAKVMFRLIDYCLGLLKETTEQRVLLAEAISLLRQLCSRNRSGGDRE